MPAEAAFAFLDEMNRPLSRLAFEQLTWHNGDNVRARPRA